MKVSHPYAPGSLPPLKGNYRRDLSRTINPIGASKIPAPGTRKESPLAQKSPGVTKDKIPELPFSTMSRSNWEELLTSNKHPPCLMILKGRITRGDLPLPTSTNLTRDIPLLPHLKTVESMIEEEDFQEMLLQLDEAIVNNYEL